MSHKKSGVKLFIHYQVISYNGCTYLFMMELKLVHVRKKLPRGILASWGANTCSRQATRPRSLVVQPDASAPMMTYCQLAHYNEVIIGTISSQITSQTIVYSTLYSDADQRIQQSCASLAFVRGIHRGPVNSPHKWPVTRKIFPFDDVIMPTK